METSGFSSINQISHCDFEEANPSIAIDLDQSNSCTNLNDSKKRNVRLIYCGDGVIEECSEDEEEKLRIEEEEKRKQQELREKMDLEAKNMSWVPWLGYMASKSAYKSLEVCDSVGEKLAWWFGITKPKFLYEIEEYNRMKQEEAEREEEDQTEEIVVGVDTVHKIVESNQITEVEMKLMKENLFQN